MCGHQSGEEIKMNLPKRVFERCEKPDAIELRDGWFAISYWLLNEKDRQTRGYYGRWCKISSDKGSVYRCLRTTPMLKKDESPAKICMDWDAWCRLTKGPESKKQISLSIRKAYFFEPMIFGGHPDPATRMAYQIAFLSLLLAILSLVVTFFPR